MNSLERNNYFLLSKIDAANVELIRNIVEQQDVGVIFAIG